MKKHTKKEIENIISTYGNKIKKNKTGEYNKNDIHWYIMLEAWKSYHDKGLV